MAPNLPGWLECYPVLRRLGRRVIGPRLVLALSRAGQSRGAGGVVTVPGLAVVDELRVRFQGLGPEPGGGSVALPVVETLNLA